METGLESWVGDIDTAVDVDEDEDDESVLALRELRGRITSEFVPTRGTACGACFQGTQNRWDIYQVYFQ
mgnify:FL=1